MLVKLEDIASDEVELGGVVESGDDDKVDAAVESEVDKSVDESELDVAVESEVEDDNELDAGVESEVEVGAESEESDEVSTDEGIVEKRVDEAESEESESEVSCTIEEESKKEEEDTSVETASEETGEVLSPELDRVVDETESTVDVVKPGFVLWLTVLEAVMDDVNDEEVAFGSELVNVGVSVSVASAVVTGVGVGVPEVTPSVDPLLLLPFPDWVCLRYFLRSAIVCSLPLIIVLGAESAFVCVGVSIAGRESGRSTSANVLDMQHLINHT